MKKVEVSKFTSYTLHALFYSVVLSGLILQITEVSVNFFRYDTVSVIKIVMPEDDDVERYFNLCVKNFQVMDEIAFAAILKERNVVPGTEELRDFFYFNLTTSERFKLTKNITTVGGDPNEYNRIYSYSDFICYQKKQNTTSDKRIYQLHKEKIKSLHVFFSPEFPRVDDRRGRVLTLDDGKLILHALSSTTHHTMRLKPPYIDNCTHFPRGKRYHYLYCKNQEKLRLTKMLFRWMLVEVNDSRYLNYSRLNYDTQSPCDDINQQRECDDYVIFTYPSLLLSFTIPLQPSMAIGVTERSNNPSQNIESKPKIEHVDYLTYILGALGSWIGFSFLQLNPVNAFFKRGDQVQPVKRECACEEEISALRSECNIYELRCKEYRMRCDAYVLRTKKNENEINKMKQTQNWLISQLENVH